MDHHFRLCVNKPPLIPCFLTCLPSHPSQLMVFFGLFLLCFLIAGVTQGFLYRMRFVYARFPINASIDGNNKSIEIRNFLGQKKVRKVVMLDAVKIVRSEKVKDEIILEGNDIELVSRSCTLINQRSHVKKKDIRKFLDWVYM